MLTGSYSSGERAGLVQKFSTKGVISKTWEGELLMMTAVLRYEQHIGIPTRLFGDTSYFVTSVRTVVQQGMVAPRPGPRLV